MANEKCGCGDKQELAKAHVAACGECYHDADDNSINPCDEFYRLFMADCGGVKNRCCAVWPDGTFEHYDIPSKRGSVGITVTGEQLNATGNPVIAVDARPQRIVKLYDIVVEIFSLHAY